MSSNHKQPLKKVVLAYSGGLDTSVIVPWLRQTYGCEVICFCANVGQGEAELDGLYERAISSGASKCYIEDLRQEFAKDFLFPLLQSGALYEGVYPLGSAISRPLIAKWLVAFAEAEGATAVAHGCTGLGNDQVRFELAIKARNPTLQIIAPWREWSIRSRADLLAYAAEHKVAVPDNDPAPFSRDRNLWHTSHEGGSLENPATPPAESLFEMTVAPEAAPDEPELVKISFERGLPVALNDVPLTPAKLITQLNEIAGRHGVGRIDIVENRLIGMKSRGVYESPAATVLHQAHGALEALALDRDTAHFKAELGLRYGELVYYGKWYHTLREAMQAFIEQTQETVTGWCQLKLYKGNVIITGRYSPNSLYREDFAAFGQADVYDQTDAEGFINIFGLPMKVKAMMEVSDGGKSRYAAPDYSKFKRD